MGPIRRGGSKGVRGRASGLVLHPATPVPPDPAPERGHATKCKSKLAGTTRALGPARDAAERGNRPPVSIRSPEEGDPYMLLLGPLKGPHPGTRGRASGLVLHPATPVHPRMPDVPPYIRLPS